METIQEYTNIAPEARIAVMIGVWLVFHLYIFYMRFFRLKKMTDSISKTVLELPDGDKWMFTIFSWLMAFGFCFMHPGLIPSAVLLGVMGCTIHYNKYGGMLHGVTATLTYATAVATIISLNWQLGLLCAASAGIIFLVLKFGNISKYVLSPHIYYKIGHEVRYRETNVYEFQEVNNITYWIEVLFFEVIMLFLVLIKVWML